MYERVCLIHYHEIGLKGRNRSTFERRLLDNLEAALLSWEPISITRIAGRLLIIPQHEEDLDALFEACRSTPGVVRVSLGWRCEREEEEMDACAKLALFDCGDFETFKVAARRSNTDYPVDSMTLNQNIGAYLCEAAPDKKVQMKDPDVTVHVEVVQGSVYVYSRTEPAVGGLPVGSSGRVVSLLSSGIDSPVASWRMMKRGAVVIGAHFSGRPETSDASEYQVDEIAETLAPFAGLARVYTVAFGTYQKRIAEVCPPKLRIILYRRLMLRVASRIAEAERAQALVTGESLGQVASQTLDNIRTVDSCVDLPVLRPLIGTDKTEIIDEAEKLGTFEISSRPAEDCCTLFMPRTPATHARIRECEAAEKDYPLDGWIEEIMEALEYKDYPCPAYHGAEVSRSDEAAAKEETAAERVD